MTYYLDGNPNLVFSSVHRPVLPSMWDTASAAMDEDFLEHQLHIIVYLERIGGSISLVAVLLIFIAYGLPPFVIHKKALRSHGWGRRALSGMLRGSQVEGTDP